MNPDSSIGIGPVNLSREGVNVQAIRSPEEGRGAFGREAGRQETLSDVRNKAESAIESDNKVIEDKVQKSRDRVIEMVNSVAGGVESTVKAVNVAYESTKAGLELVRKQSADVIVGTVEDGIDVVKGTLKGAVLTVVGLPVGVVTLGLVAGAEISLLAAEGGVKLHGAVENIRHSVRELLNGGIRAAAAYVEVKAMETKLKAEEKKPEIGQAKTDAQRRKEDRVQAVRNVSPVRNLSRMLKGH